MRLRVTIVESMSKDMKSSHRSGVIGMDGTDRLLWPIEEKASLSLFLITANASLVNQSLKKFRKIHN